MVLTTFKAGDYKDDKNTFNKNDLIIWIFFTVNIYMVYYLIILYLFNYLIFLG